MMMWSNFSNEDLGSHPVAKTGDFVWAKKFLKKLPLDVACVSNTTLLAFCSMLLDKRSFNFMFFV